MGFSPLIYALKNLYRAKTRAALTDVKMSATRSLHIICRRSKGRGSCHTARHEAANGGSERSLDGPDHRPARPVRLCNHCIIMDTSIHSLSTRTRVVAALGFPIRVRKSETSRIRTARSLARSEAVKPWLE